MLLVFCSGLALLASPVAAASFLVAFRTATVFAAFSATALLFAAVLGASSGSFGVSFAASILAALGTTALFFAAVTSAGCGSFSRSRFVALGSLLRQFLAANHSNKQGA